MRISRLAALTAAATTTLAFAVAPATEQAATPDLETVPYMSTDTAGDANGLNGQGLADIVGQDVPETSTGPAQSAESDILGARITSLFDEVPGTDGLLDNVLTGLEFRIGMAAEPSAASIPQVHRFIGTAGGCEFWVTVDTGTGLAPQGDASIGLFGTGCGIPDDATTGTRGSEYVSGDWLTYAWDDEFSEMVLSVDLTTADQRLSSRINRGDFYQLAEVHNRVSTLITAPVLDEMLTPGFAVIGDDIPADEGAEDGPEDGDEASGGGGQSGPDQG